MKLRIPAVVAGLLSLALLSVPLMFAQTSTETASALPRLVRFGGTVKDLNGTPMTGVVGITFALYSEQTGGVALWVETQNVTADGNGRYVAVLGSTKAGGLPTDLFTSEQARWVGVQVSGQAEQARVLLVSAPYALKAGDAETIGGLPPSAFVLAVSGNGGQSTALANESAPTVSASNVPLTTSDVTTTGGTIGALAVFNAATSVQSSLLSQTGTTAINVKGQLNLPALSTATSTTAFNSRPLDFVASVFNSSTSTAVPETFQWQAEAQGNDTTNATGSLNLLFGQGTSKPAETGLRIANNGQIIFANGQTFPGTGTITGITTASGSGLSGGGTTGMLSLKVPSAGITNAMLADSTITLNASTSGGLTVPGAMTLGDTYSIGLKTCSANQVLEYVGTAWTCASAGTGTVTSVASGSGLTGGPITGSGTLSINPAVVPQLAAANAFTSTNTFSNLTTVNAASAISPALNITNSSGVGILISATNSLFGYGVDVPSAGVFGVYASAGYQGGYFKGANAGTYSENDVDSDGAVAAYAYEFGTTKQDIGFWGYSASTAGIGVYGQAVQASNTGEQFAGNQPAGVWGDSGAPVVNTRAVGVFGSADDGSSVVGYNDSPSGYATADFENFESADPTWPVLSAASGYYEQACVIDVSGNLSCTGKIGAAATVDGGLRKVALNSVQSPEAWFEDAGSGQLTAGQAIVNIETIFGQTINTGVEYHVFLTPNGDCKGLYVAEKSATSFVVKELGGGTSSIAFDYRIMAKRKSFENVRLVDVTRAMTINRPLKSSANAKHLPTAESIRKQTQEHAKRPMVAGLSGPASK